MANIEQILDQTEKTDILSFMNGEQRQRQEKLLSIELNNINPSLLSIKFSPI